MRSVVVIGGGVNGLVAAAVLARAHLVVTLVEQRPVVGGAAITTELAPGFQVPTLSHALGPVSQDVLRALRLDRSPALEWIRPDPVLTSLGPDGRALVFHRDAVLTAASIHAGSAADAGRWMEFVKTTERIAGVAARLHRLEPPPLDGLRARDWWRLAGLVRDARALGRRDLATLARWVPMSIADLTGEWFEDDLLRAAMSAHALTGHPAGPRSAGTGWLWLQRLAADPAPVGSGVTLRGGPGALTAVLARAASDAGATIRTDARVSRILLRDGSAAGVSFEQGDVVEADAVVAAISPSAAMTRLVDPAALAPSVRQRFAHVRARGVTAKINLALSALPSFPAIDGDAAALGGRLLIAPGLDDLERAFDATKYGAMSDVPWLEIAIPSVRDATLAPPGAHVMSIYAQCAPRHLRDAAWAQARETLWARVLALLERHAAGIAGLIVTREVLTPEDLECDWGLPGGHIFHGEMAIDQSWAARPVLGWGRYRSPIPGLYFASAGAHPGGGLTGRPGWLAAQAVLEDRRG